VPRPPRANLSKEALEADYFSDFTENNITNLEVAIHELPKGSKRRQYLEDEHARIKQQLDSGEFFRRQLYAGDFDPKPIGKYLTPQAEATESPSSPVLRALGRGLESVKGALNNFSLPEVPITPFNAMAGLKSAVETGLGGRNKIGDFAVGNADREVNRWAYGDSPFKMPKANSSIPYIPEGRKKDVADAIGFLPLSPGVGDNVALSAVKGKGGNWSSVTQWGITGHAPYVGMDAFGREQVGIIPKPGTVDDWFNKSFKKYQDRYLGTTDDPIKDAVIEGKRWEDWTDSVIVSEPIIKDRKNINEPLETEKGWTVNLGNATITNNYPASFFKEVKEYMSGIPEAKRQQYSFPRAVQETLAWQEKMAREQAKKNEWRNIPEKLMEGNTVTKEYPDGRKWTTLDRDKPIAFARQSCLFGNCVGQAAHEGDKIWHVVEPETGFPLWTKLVTGKDGLPTTKARKYEYQYSNQQPGPEWIKFDKNGYMYDDVTIHTLRGPDSKTKVMISVDDEPAGTFSKAGKSISQIKGDKNGVIPKDQRDAVIDFINTHNIQSIKETHDRWPGIIATYDPDSKRMFAMTREEAIKLDRYGDIDDTWSDKRIEHYLETVIIPNRRK